MYRSLLHQEKLRGMREPRSFSLPLSKDVQTTATFLSKRRAGRLRMFTRRRIEFWYDRRNDLDIQSHSLSRYGQPFNDQFNRAKWLIWSSSLVISCRKWKILLEKILNDEIDKSINFIYSVERTTFPYYDNSCSKLNENDYWFVPVSDQSSNRIES